jgi:hypothetical protein
MLIGAQAIENPRVGGSIPPRGTISFDIIYFNPVAS